ncbi:MAG: GH32 C-terminal domain-containing protein [Pontiellaceae bacterium]|nr:GH32 C-terminal domain-containing protein [Pontiellaceae bacterium]MBN2786242.1 GH32 C-terminal domain-containing protein [Pontiellaceae bacterium]
MNKMYSGFVTVAALILPCTAGALTSTMFEGEACSDKSSDVSVSTYHFPYIGSGYLDMGGKDSYVEWNQISVPADGDYSLLIRYSNATEGSDRSCDLAVNGVACGSLSFPCIYTDWTKPYLKRVTIPLKKGTNTIRLTANSDAGGPNVDNIAVTEGGMDAPKGRLFKVTDYGARGNGERDNTRPIQKTIDACTPGGTVVIPPGVFMCGHIKLKSNMTLWLSEGAVLKAIQDNDKYPATLPDTDNANVSKPDTWGGGGWELRRSFIWADDTDNLTIRGGGTIDGNGDCEIWAPPKDEIVRPMPLYITRSRNVVVRDIQIQDAAMWDLVFLECKGVAVDGIIIHSIFGWNKDGIDICDSHDVTIANSAIWCEDDAICPKSGSAMGVKNLMVKNVSLVTTGNLIKFGTLSYGSFTDAVFEDISMQNGLVGICIQVIDGADVNNITYNRIRMTNLASPIYLIHGGGIRGHRPEGAEAKWGTLRNVTIDDVDARNIRYATGALISGTTVGRVTYRPQDITLNDVRVNSFLGGKDTRPSEPPEYDGTYPEVGKWGDHPAWGYYVRHAENIVFNNCSETVSPGDARPARLFSDTIGNRGNGTPGQASGAYGERYRPQFHFTSRKNWINDPNGCVYYDGEYHLFFQHNPEGVQWGNMTWGHAVSKDMVHWTQLPHAIAPYDGGTIFSGTAVVDHNNSLGKQTGDIQTIAACFTFAHEPFYQALAYSTDKGRTFSLINEGRAVVPNQGFDPGERDPKIFWHEASQKWVMVLWVKQGQPGRVRFFNSDNLVDWERVSDFERDWVFECMDFVELAVDGNPDNKKWLLYDASFDYEIGDFDGKTFTTDGKRFIGDLGSNFYAAQTFNNSPDGRTVIIGWMRDGKYPDMPFNGQMSFPCTMELRTLPDGVRLCRAPIKEIKSLYVDSFELQNCMLKENGNNPLASISGDLFDIEMVIEPGQASGFGLSLHGQTIRYAENQISCLGRSATLPLVDGKVKLRILVDRTSLELFGNQGDVVLSSCFLPENLETGLELYSVGGDAKIISLRVSKLRSAWGLDSAPLRD